MTLIEYKLFRSRLINTSEAYSKVFFIGNNNVVIPYINIGLMPDNPVNGEASFAEYSYFVFWDVGTVVFNAKEIMHLESSISKGASFEEYIILDGCGSSTGAEVKISCNGLSFYLSRNTRISKQSNSFIPVDTTVYKQNMVTSEVASFFSKAKLPEIIIDILGEPFYVIFVE